MDTHALFHSIWKYTNHAYKNVLIWCDNLKIHIYHENVYCASLNRKAQKSRLIHIQRERVNIDFNYAIFRYFQISIFFFQKKFENWQDLFLEKISPLFDNIA